MSIKAKHPNRVPFEGLLARLDTPSDAAPSGSRGHRVILTLRAAVEALPTLEGMAVGFTAAYDGHDARRKCGIVEDCWITGDELRVAGFLYLKDFPEIGVQMRKPDVEMGMSYELADAHVLDMRAEVWTLTKVTFTGAAILLRDKAAYKTTRFDLAAAEEPFTGEMVGEVMGTVTIGEV